MHLLLPGIIIPAMDTPLLIATGLERRDQGRARLTDFHLHLGRGEVIGLLGVNGAGKSTALALLSGALAPTRGRVEVLGRNLHGSPAVRRHIGLLPERIPLYPQLTVEENLDFAGRLRGLRHRQLKQARTRVMEQLALQDFGRRLCARLSRGMAQRTAIAQALIHAPDILILDEPTAGLDPAQAQELRDHIRRLSPGCGVLLASHILEDMEQLCNRVMVLNEGRVVAEQSLEEDNSLRIRLGRPPETGTDFLTALSGVTGATDQGNGWYLLRIQVPPESLVPRLAAWDLQALLPARFSLQSLIAEIRT